MSLSPNSPHARDAKSVIHPYTNLAKHEQNGPLILEEGDVIFSKSRVRDKPCPSYAIEGTTEDGQFVRIVFAKCDSITRVVTAIDLGVKHDCDCN